MDDIWGSDDEFTESVDIKKLRKIHSQRGYLDGITSSKEMNLQEGFNTSFPTGAKLGSLVGQVLGRLQMQMALGKITKDELDTAIEELKINNILTKQYFDDNHELQGEHPVVAKYISPE